MNDNVVFVSINAPRIHQAIITKLIYRLSDLYFKDETMLFPYPETMIDESQTSPAPDVMLVNPENDLSEVIIEITHTQGVKKDIQKLKNLMQNYSVKEGFVYDYKQKIWYKITDDNLNESIQTSFCEAISKNLNDFL